MKSKISIRQLTSSEVDVYKKAGINYTVFASESISIMGSSENFYLKNLNIPIKSNLVDLGPGYGYQDLSFSTEADGIKSLPIASKGTTFNYFLNILNELDIPVLLNTRFDLVFFESKNTEIFVKSLLAGEDSLNRWLNDRSLFSSWFGATSPDYQTEGKQISDEIRRVLINS